MRILVAPDKFKGSLGAAEVAENVALGLREVLPSAEITIQPVADGGEGTAQIIGDALGGVWVTTAVHDAMGNEVEGRFVWLEGRKLAVLDLTEVAGLSRSRPEERDPTTASTFGSGELLRAAERHGAAEIIVGLGGSATNDGGFGMARALGFGFLDEHDRPIVGLREIETMHRIEGPIVLHVRTSEGLCRKICGSPIQAKVIAAADVKNPLLGERGATRMFGRQKGATDGQIERLERGLRHLADVLTATDSSITALGDVPGAGAAGGLGFGLIAFCGAEMRSGFDVMAECIGLDAAVRSTDVVITGEGRLDAQTLEGKAAAGIAGLARTHGKKCFAIVGSATADVRTLFDGVSELVVPPVTYEQALANPAEFLRLRARELAVRLQTVV